MNKSLFEITIKDDGYFYITLTKPDNTKELIRGKVKYLKQLKELIENYGV